MFQIITIDEAMAPHDEKIQVKRVRESDPLTQSTKVIIIATFHVKKGNKDYNSSLYINVKDANGQRLAYLERGGYGSEWRDWNYYNLSLSVDKNNLTHENLKGLKVDMQFSTEGGLGHDSFYFDLIWSFMFSNNEVWQFTSNGCSLTNNDRQASWTVLL